MDQTLNTLIQKCVWKSLAGIGKPEQKRPSANLHGPGGEQQLIAQSNERYIFHEDMHHEKATNRRQASMIK